MANDKGWTMLSGGDADAMIDRYIAARTPQGSRPLHAELRAENEHLRLALAAMAARERETAAERDALRTMLVEARTIIGGRAVPPTDAEIDAHAAAGGLWIVVDGAGAGYVRSHLPTVREIAGWHRDRDASWTWLPLDRNRRICAWPTTGGAP